MSIWKPIEDAPDDLFDRLVFCPDTHEMFVAYRSKDDPSLWIYANGRKKGHEIACRPRYYAELPSPPIGPGTGIAA